MCVCICGDWFVCAWLEVQNSGMSGCVCVQQSVSWDKCLAHELTDQSVFLSLCMRAFLYSMWVWTYVSLLTRLSEQIRRASCLMLSGNFPRGTVILSSARSCTKVPFCLCSKSLFSQPAASTGEREHVLQTSMRNTLTKQTTNSQHGYRNADNVSLSLFLISFPLSPSGKNYRICQFVILSWVFSAVLCECSEVSHGRWWEKKKDPGSISYRLPKVAGPSVFLPPEQQPTFAFHHLSFSFCPSFYSFSSKLRQNRSSVVSSYALGAKVL